MIYLDNAATTRMAPQVLDAMLPYLTENYGNPGGVYGFSVAAKKVINEAREVIADSLGAERSEIYFTSGGTESDNLAIIGAAVANARAGKHLITTVIEHPAVLQTMHYLETCGFEVTYLPVDKDEQISLEDLHDALREDTILVSIMHTNNEIGSLQPIADVGALIKGMNPRTLFHVDAVQGFGKARIYPKKMGIDMLSVSGHKIHGPKGVGFLYVGEKVKIHNISYGGGQQKNLRSGTENVPGIAGLAKAAEILYADLDEDIAKLRQIKSKFIEGLKELPDMQVNGKIDEESAPHIVSVSVRGVRSEVLLHALEDKGIYVSAGSACASNKPQTSGSATLRSIALDKDLLDSTIRFSFSVETTEEEIDYTLNAMYDIIPMLRKYTRR
jgi:cysteine desulfurase